MLWQVWQSQTLPHDDSMFPIWAACVPTNARLWDRLQEEYVSKCLDQRRTAVRPTVSEWFQLEVISESVRVVAPTQFGINPFNLDLAGEYRCPRGHSRGLNVLSEIWVSDALWDRADILATADLVGSQSAHWVPSPIMLCTPAFRRFVISNKITGIDFEVAHFAGVAGP